MMVVLSMGLPRRAAQAASFCRRILSGPHIYRSRQGLFTSSFVHYGSARQRQARLGQDRDSPGIKPALQQQQQQQQQQHTPFGPREKKQVTLHEDIYTIPNFLTLSRLVAAPFVGYLVLQDAHSWAIGLLTYAGVTDLLDGWIARRWNRRTVVGTVIDPMADKVLMTVLTICLAAKGALPVWLVAIILGRDVGLAMSAIYFRWISLPPPKTFARYWDFSLPSAEIHPTTISKVNTFLQLALVGLTTAAPIIAVDMAPTLACMQYLVATTTIWSGVSYIYTKDAVKILNTNSKKP